MSLNQRYTWHDFLKEYPEHKEKGTKRTSPEGKKAFETAYKTHIKKYLSKRMERVEKLVVRASERRKANVEKTKAFRKAGQLGRMKVADKRIGKADAAIARHQKLSERNKQLQKTFK